MLSLGPVERRCESEASAGIQTQIRPLDTSAALFNISVLVQQKTSSYSRPEENFRIVACYIGAAADPYAHDETNQAEDGGTIERQLVSNGFHRCKVIEIT